MRVTIDTDELKLKVMNSYMKLVEEKSYVSSDTLKGICLIINEIEKRGGK